MYSTNNKKGAHVSAQLANGSLFPTTAKQAAKWTHFSVLTKEETVEVTAFMAANGGFVPQFKATKSGQFFHLLNPDDFQAALFHKFSPAKLNGATSRSRVVKVTGAGFTAVHQAALTLTCTLCVGTLQGTFVHCSSNADARKFMESVDFPTTLVTLREATEAYREWVNQTNK